MGTRPRRRARLELLAVRRARLAMTTVDPAEHPDPDRPEIAFVGRSNVGKSSLLNTLIRQRLARTSRSPGKTQTINYYAVDDACYFVDLPGYGYAAAPAAVRQRWGPMTEAYLENSPRLAGIVSLVDGRHPPTPLDRAMAGWLADRGLPVLVTLTKADKIGRGSREARAVEAATSLGLDGDQVVWCSSVTGEGREQVLEAVEGLLVRSADA